MRGLKLTLDNEEIFIASSKGLNSQNLEKGIESIITEYISRHNGSWQSIDGNRLNSTPVEITVGDYNE